MRLSTRLLVTIDRLMHHSFVRLCDVAWQMEIDDLAAQRWRRKQLWSTNPRSKMTAAKALLKRSAAAAAKLVGLGGWWPLVLGPVLVTAVVLFAAKI